MKWQKSEAIAKATGVKRDLSLSQSFWKDNKRKVDLFHLETE